MSAHSRDHEDLRWRVIDRVASQADRRVLSKCPQCRHDLDALTDTMASIERAARLDRDDVLRIATAAPVAGEDDFQARLLDVMRGTSVAVANEVRPAAAPSRRRTEMFASLAAAAAVALWLGLRGSSPDVAEPAPSVTLAGGDVELVAPIGDGSSFGRFTWRGGQLRGGSYRLMVMEADAPADGEALLDREVLSPSLTLDPDTAAALPDSIRWHVWVLDDTGRPMSRTTGFARRPR